MWSSRFRWNRKRIAFFSLAAFILTACSDAVSTNENKTKPVSKYPFGFDSIVSPEDNQITAARIKLGQKIFFDPQFSADGKISCASCHKPELAFADTVATHKGAHDSLNFRNTPSLLNIGYHPLFNYDGGVPTLELQVLVPMEAETEMNTNLLKTAEIMKANSEYVSLAKQAYNREPDPFVIVRALGAFQRQLISRGSRYDLYKKTKGKKGLTPDEIDGMNLFFSSKTNCSKCHDGFLFSNFKFESIGLQNNSNDTGRARVTIRPEDVGKFKTQPLRNVAKTPPYMHDGSIKTLEEVVEFYDRGGDVKRNLSPHIKPLHLTLKEKQNLVKFLISLNDTL